MPFRFSLLGALLLVLVAAPFAHAQAPYAKATIAHRAERDSLFRSDGSPLVPSQREAFAGLNYYAINGAYNVPATFTPSEDATPFAMPHTQNVTRQYRKIGTLAFELDGEARTLDAYWSAEADVPDAPVDSLFIPFKDATNGDETYGGGRYLYLPYDGSGSLDLNFNLAYAPHCAYNPAYACPLPPRANHLGVRIPAGEQNYDGWYHLVADDLGVAADFPGEPVFETDVDEDGIESFQYVYEGDSTGVSYLLSGLRFPSLEGSPESVLGRVVDRLADSFSARVSDDRPLTLGAYPGHEVLLRASSGEVMWWRGYVVEDKMLQVLVGVPPGTDPADVRENRFYASLSLLPGATKSRLLNMVEALGYDYTKVNEQRYNLTWGWDAEDRTQLLSLVPGTDTAGRAAFYVVSYVYVSNEPPTPELLHAVLVDDAKYDTADYNLFVGEDGSYNIYVSAYAPADATPAVFNNLLNHIASIADEMEKAWVEEDAW